MDAQTREIAPKLSIFDTKMSSLYRIHQKTLQSIPSTRPSIQLTGKFRLITSQEQFLQADDGDIRYNYSRQQNIFYSCVLQSQSTVIVHFTLLHQCLTRYSLSTLMLVTSCFRWYSL
jgi:hypothetical protein